MLKKILFTSITALITAMPFCSRAEFNVDLKKVVNADFKDEVAGDGKGGWSDQGPLNDMNAINVKRTNYGGMNFKLINPAENNGKAVMVFESRHFKTGLKTAKIVLSKPYPKASYLYLLHSSCYNQLPKGTTVGTVEISFADGSGILKKIKKGVEVNDWWNPASCSNGKVVFTDWNGCNSAGIFLSRFEIARKPKEINEIIFRSKGNIVWIVMGVTLSRRAIPVNDNTKKVFREDGKWKAVDTSDIQIKAGSALDMSSFLADAPAGKHGRIIINSKGRLAFADNPETSRCFKGFTGFFSKAWADLKGSSWKQFFKNINKKGWRKKITRENITQYAKNLRRQGYDAIRPLGVERMLMVGSTKDYKYNPEILDDVDWLFNEMKKNGVYIWLPIGGYGFGYSMKYPDDLEKSYNTSTPKHIKIAILLGEGTALKHWENNAKNMLNHVNPYTGLAWKDDPAIMGIEFLNEQLLTAILRLKPNKQPLNIQTLLKRKWNKWLEDKYKTTNALARAWGRSKQMSFSKIMVPKMGIFGSGPKINDFSCFLRDLAFKRVLWYEKIVREAGYKGLTSTGFSASKQMLDSSVQWRSSQTVCSNNYSGGDGFSPIGGSKIWQNSLIRQSGGYWLSTNASRFADRPFMVTEHAFTFWNRHRHEDGIIWGAYSAFQGFSVIHLHNDVVKLKAESGIGNGAMKTFPEATSPVYRANEFLVTCLFRRGDISKAKHRVQLDIPISYVRSNCNGNRAVNLQQSKIALITGFNIAFPKLKKIPGVGSKIVASNLTVAPGKGAVVKSTDWDSRVSSSSEKSFSLGQFCRTLRKRGIIGKDNISDPDKDIFQSDTGEITMHSKKMLLKVITARSEAVVVKHSESEQLKNLRVNSTSVPACIAVCSVDGKDLKKSSRIVLVYSTNDVNSGMELSADERVMYKLGKLPILMRCGKLNVTLKNVNEKKMALYALGINGSRKEKLALSVSNNKININIDTSKLKNGPTPFFELVVE